MKRILDTGLALLALIVAAPLLLGIAVVIASRLGRPVLFCQSRPGLHGKPFRMFKFRTMSNDKDGSGRTRPDKFRLTSVGRFLRAWSLDELPELWNVLEGNMSLVGPRPLLMEYLQLYSRVQARRHEVRPGITGWAQVNGRNALSWEDRFAMDVWYVDNQSLWLDMKILWMTARRVIEGNGISQAGEATMSKFTGS